MTASLYRCCLAETITGLVVGDIPFTGVPSWSRGTPGSLSAVVSLGPPKAAPMDPVMRRRLKEGPRWTLIWAYGSKILQAGLLKKPDVAETAPQVTLNTWTMRDWFEQKTRVLNPNNGIDKPAADVNFAYDGGKVTTTDPANRNLTLHSIARRLIEIALQANTLPISLPDPIAGTGNERQYAAADLASVGQRLAELSAVVGGPEIEFSPRWTDDNHDHITWRVRIGNPRLGQLGDPHVWDYGQAWQSITPSQDWSDYTAYVIAKGADTRQAADVKSGTAASGSLFWAGSSFLSPYVQAGWPLAATVDTTHSDTQNNTLLQQYADSDLTIGQRPVETATGVIRLDARNNVGTLTGSPSIDRLSIGDTGILNIRGHHWYEDGQYRIRLLQLDSTDSLNTAKVSVQWLGAM